MEFSDIIAKRRSIRQFRPGDVSDETIRLLLDAARLSPSGSNIQPWRFVVAKSASAKELLSQCTPYKFIEKAAVIFVCCADLTSMSTRKQRIEELIEVGAFQNFDTSSAELATYASTVKEAAEARAYLTMNVAIAVEHIVLRAVDMNLGSCWLGRFNRDMVKKILSLDENIYPVVLLPVGYDDQSPAQRPRMPLEQLVIKVM